MSLPRITPGTGRATSGTGPEGTRFHRPLHIDDRISLAGFEGAVIDVDLRYTTLHAGERRVHVPNSIVLTNAISVLEAAEPARARGR